ncbi:MAG: alpha/beta fold hydrolase [Rhodospirillales bacterium]|nr:alpha/beta fold hydrolase [Rhodospirillales bacterium]
MRGGDGPPVLFLHGAGGAGVWLPFMERLAEHHEVIVPDHPGYGHSDTPDWLDELPDLAFFYLDFLEAQGLSGVHVVGSSLGGWVGAEMAIRDSSRLASLTLVNAAGIHVDGAPKGDLFLWTPEERVRNLFHDPAIAEARLAIEPTEEEADIGLKNEFTTAKLAWSPRFYNPQLRKWVHRIKLPTLVVWGDDDRIFPAEYAAAWHELIPGSRMEIFPDCGHLPHVEKSDAFVDTFNRFIAEI